jgi:menaquinone-dependent protoporphyrinogen oxidase
VRTLILYASTHGHTAKIASHLAEAIRRENCHADIRDARHDSPPSPTDYGGVIIAASLHGGHHQREVVDAVKRHRDDLERSYAIFISVSLTAAEDTEEAREATQKCIDDFVEETGWQPARAIPVAGALQYREYDVATRTLLRLMMRRGGHPTDTSHDYDYTDWDAVSRIGAEFVAELSSRTRPGAPRVP